jgi:hypothetical protein
MTHHSFKREGKKERKAKRKEGRRKGGREQVCKFSVTGAFSLPERALNRKHISCPG